MIFFINSENRYYNDHELNKVFRLLFNTGIFNTLQSTIESWKTDGDFLVKINSGMDLTVNKGTLNLPVTVGGVEDTHLVTLGVDTDITISANSSGDDRVDAVIVRVDQSVIDADTINETGTNVVTVEVVSGSGATALSDGDISTALGGDPFVRLADVTVGDGVASIGADKIADTRVYAETKNSVQFKGERFRFIGLDADPSDAQNGDLWFSTGDEALKLKTAESVISFTSSSFDIYSDGVAIENTSGSDVLNSTVDFGASGVYVYAGGGSYTFELRLWQVFTAPVADLGSIFLKKGITREDWNRPVKISIMTVDGSGNIGGTTIESFTYTATEWQALTPNTPFELELTETYTADTEYGILFEPDSSSDSDDSAVLITSSIEEGSTIPPYKRNFNDLIGTSPFDDYYTQEGENLWFRIVTREVVNLGTSVNNKIGQIFTANGKDMISVTLRKGTDQGLPTGDISIYLYDIDENENPVDIENPISERIITDTEWNALTDNEEFTINLSASLALGVKYLISIEPVNISDTNYRELWAGTLNDTYSAGKMRKAVGSTWTDLDFDLYFKINESASDKIVKTRKDGTIDPKLLETTPFSIFPDSYQDVVLSATSTGNVMTHNLNKIPRFIKIVSRHQTTIFASSTSFIKVAPDGTIEDWFNDLFRFDASSEVFQGTIRNDVNYKNSTYQLYVPDNSTGDEFQLEITEITENNITFRTLNDSFFGNVICRFEFYK